MISIKGLRINWPIVILLAFGCSGIFFFYRYIQPTIAHLLAVIVLPLLTTKQDNRTTGFLIFIPALLCFLVSGWLGLKSLLFLGYIFCVIGLLPYLGLRAGILLFFGIILFSPIWRWFDLNISFALRLMLTDWAGYLLKGFNTGYTIDGNWIKGPRGEFSVEAACAGLNMLKYALLGGLLMLSLRAKNIRQSVRASAPFSFLAIIFILSIFSNLCRILFLVFMPLAPETLAHEMIGLLYIFMMVLLPVYFVLWKFPHLFFTKKSPPAITNLDQGYLTLPVIVLSAFLFSGFAVLNHTPATHLSHTLVKRWEKFEYQGTIKGVHKFSKPHFLVWIKPLEGFYSAEHSPLGCWTGSGYIFKETQLGKINGEFYPRGMLQSEGDILYTAWWFESETTKTGDALAWRKEALWRNETFYLVNITSDRPEKLQEAIDELWK